MLQTFFFVFLSRGESLIGESHYKKWHALSSSVFLSLSLFLCVTYKKTLRERPGLFSFLSLSLFQSRTVPYFWLCPHKSVRKVAKMPECTTFFFACLLLLALFFLPFTERSKSRVVVVYFFFFNNNNTVSIASFCPIRVKKSLSLSQNILHPRWCLEWRRRRWSGLSLSGQTVVVKKL